MPTALLTKETTGPIAKTTTVPGQGAQPKSRRPGRSNDRRRPAFGLLLVACFMTIVDFTIVNVAVPSIGRSLHFPEADLQWLVTAYGLTSDGD
jgi:hypothetical protein